MPSRPRIPPPPSGSGFRTGMFRTTVGSMPYSRRYHSAMRGPTTNVWWTRRISERSTSLSAALRAPRE